LQKYDVSDDEIESLGTVQSHELNDDYRRVLEEEFRKSWEEHLEEFCDFDCINMPWPTR
jgi:hypothetical protein